MHTSKLVKLSSLWSPNRFSSFSKLAEPSPVKDFPGQAQKSLIKKVTWKDIPKRIVHVHVVKEDVLQIVGLETALGTTAAKLLENLALQFRFVVRQG